ncbi:MAG: hypothetical protein HY909_12735 [Deltaproteobacteria bacterium]|nr:hypothetical protein [Deltaproteobacteria bacterium]
MVLLGAALVLLPLLAGVLAYARGVDRMEPEPLGLLLALVGAGAALLPLTTQLELQVLTLLPGNLPLAREALEVTLAVGCVGAVHALAPRVFGAGLDGALDGALALGLVVLGFSLADVALLVTARPPSGGRLTEVLGVTQALALASLSRLGSALPAGLGLGLALERPPGAGRLPRVLGGLAVSVLLAAVDQRWRRVAPGGVTQAVTGLLLALSWFVALAGLRAREAVLLRRALGPELARGTLSEAELEALLDGRHTPDGRTVRLARLGLLLVRRMHGDARPGIFEAEHRLRERLGTSPVP